MVVTIKGNFAILYQATIFRRSIIPKVRYSDGPLFGLGLGLGLWVCWGLELPVKITDSYSVCSE